MALALRRHLRSPLDPDPGATIARAMRNRNPNFLTLVRPVFADSAHPYAQLFKIAGCAYADLESEVNRNGLETTLRALSNEGVYLTHDEFRGRKEIVRAGRHIPASIASWDNPAVRGEFETVSSGTSGRPVSTMSSQALLAHAECGTRLFLHELGVGQGSSVSVAPILPGFGLFSGLLASRLIGGFDRWYALSAASAANLHYRIVTRALVANLRLFGAKIPYPTYLDHNDFRPVAEYLAMRRAAGVNIGVSGFVSSISRVAAAALDHNLDISGCLGVVAGEALTDAKRTVIEAAGIRVYPTYGATDFGSIGMPCREMDTGNCVHVLQQNCALISKRREGIGDRPVESLYLTGILPFASRILVNAEIGDTGVIEPATCDCSFSRLGLNLQVRDIAAISKVTAQGMTIAADELVQVLEEALPARFGGRPGDYQLLEVEAEAQTEMVLRIRPGVTEHPAQEILNHFLGETRRLYGGSMSVLSWLHSDGIRAEVAPPVLAGTGKFRAVRLLGPGITGKNAASRAANF